MFDVVVTGAITKPVKLLYNCLCGSQGSWSMDTKRFLKTRKKWALKAKPWLLHWCGRIYVCAWCELNSLSSSLMICMSHTVQPFVYELKCNSLCINPFTFIVHQSSALCIRSCTEILLHKGAQAYTQLAKLVWWAVFPLGLQLCWLYIDKSGKL